MRKFLTISLTLIILAVVFFGWWFYYKTYSDGSRSGLLQKFSHRGDVFKTYEGELVLSSVQSTGGVSIASEKFNFSVVDERVADSLKKYEGNYVKLFYKEKRKAIPWRGDSRYIVDSVIFLHSFLNNR